MNEKVRSYGIMIAFAVITYALVYIITNYGLHNVAYDWRFNSASVSLNYALMPIFGFIFGFFGLEYWKKTFDEKRNALLALFMLFILVSLLSFAIAVWFFYKPTVDMAFSRIADNFKRANRELPYFSYNVCFANCKSPGFGCFLLEEQNRYVCEINFWNELFRSAFFPFWLACLLAGFSFFAYDFLLNYKRA